MTVFYAVYVVLNLCNISYIAMGLAISQKCKLVDESFNEKVLENCKTITGKTDDQTGNEETPSGVKKADRLGGDTWKDGNAECEQTYENNFFES